MYHFHPDQKKTARHVGIIPDGGRRWAVQNECSLQQAYSLTRSKLKTYVPLLLDSGVNELSVYLSSKLNFQREDKEIEAFNKEVVDAFLHDFGHMGAAFGLRITVAGDTSSLGSFMKNTIDDVVQQTKNGGSGSIHLLINYDPLEEIEQAFERAAQSRQHFWEKLWVDNPLDLVIRSGGANVMSNFLPLQSAYARLYFFDALFNALEWADIERCLSEYRGLDRKYGN